VHGEDIHGERPVVRSAPRDVEGIVEDHETRGGTGREPSFLIGTVLLGVGAAEQRTIDKPWPAPNPRTFPRDASILSSLLLVLGLFPGGPARIVRSVDCVHVVRQQALESAARDEGHTPGVVDSQTNVCRARVSMSDQEAADQLELERPIVGRFES
jgi:hypothetical protein